MSGPSGRRGLDADVLVVGAGPVGLLLAGELRLGGAEVVVVERLPEPTGESRASQLDARTMEILDERGLRARLGWPPRERAGHLGGLRVDVGDVPSPYAGFWKVPQHRTEALLGAWARRRGAQVRRGVELRDLTVHEDHVEAVVDDAAGGGRGTVGRLRASYLVGCDGGNSTVRALVGIDDPGTDATCQLLRADVAGITIPNRRFERRPRGLAIAARRDDGITRVMVHELDRPVRPGGEPPFAEMVEAWARVTGEDIGAGTPIWINAFDNTTRQAAQYRRGRVLLAGDAAHRHLPIGGQALNLGLQDAFNLGWKLARHVRGDADPALLDSYHTERHPVGARVLSNVRAQEQLLLGPGSVEPLREVVAELLGLRAGNDHLARMLSGLDVRYDVGRGTHPLLGARLPAGDVLRRATKVRTTTVLRGGRGLLVRGASAGHPPDGEHLPVPVVAPLDGPARDLFGDLDEDGTVLVRPDGHVAWIGSDRDGLDEALARWVGPSARPVHPGVPSA